MPPEDPALPDTIADAATVIHEDPVTRTDPPLRQGDEVRAREEGDASRQLSVAQANAHAAALSTSAIDLALKQPRAEGGSSVQLTKKAVGRNGGPLRRRSTALQQEAFVSDNGVGCAQQSQPEDAITSIASSPTSKSGSSKKLKRRQQADKTSACRCTVYLVLDSVELLREWEGSGPLLATLLALPESPQLPGLALILIARVGWDAFRGGTGAREPLLLFFPDYSDQELQQILAIKRSASSYLPFLK